VLLLALGRGHLALVLPAEALALTHLSLVVLVILPLGRDIDRHAVDEALALARVEAGRHHAVLNVAALCLELDAALLLSDGEPDELGVSLGRWVVRLARGRERDRRQGRPELHALDDRLRQLDVLLDPLAPGVPLARLDALLPPSVVLLAPLGLGKDGRPLAPLAGLLDGRVEWALDVAACDPPEPVLLSVRQDALVCWPGVDSRARVDGRVRRPLGQDLRRPERLLGRLRSRD
jgi:hypothetical protein